MPVSTRSQARSNKAESSSSSSAPPRQKRTAKKPQVKGEEPTQEEGRNVKQEPFLVPPPLPPTSNKVMTSTTSKKILKEKDQPKVVDNVEDADSTPSRAPPTKRAKSLKIPSTSTAVVPNNKKKVKTTAKSRVPSSAFAGRQPRLFDDSTSEEDIEMPPPRPPPPVIKKPQPEKKNVVATTTKAAAITQTSKTYSSRGSGGTVSQDNTKLKMTCTVSLSPLRQKLVPAKNLSQAAQEPTPTVEKKQLPPPQPEKKQLRSRKGRFQEGEGTKNVIKVVEELKKVAPVVKVDETTTTSQPGRQLRTRNADHKAVTAAAATTTKRAFLPGELDNVDPGALASNCRMAAGHMIEVFQHYEKTQKIFAKRGEEIRKNFETSLRELRSRKAQQAQQIDDKPKEVVEKPAKTKVKEEEPPIANEDEGDDAGSESMFESEESEESEDEQESAIFEKSEQESESESEEESELEEAEKSESVDDEPTPKIEVSPPVENVANTLQKLQLTEDLKIKSLSPNNIPLRRSSRKTQPVPDSKTSYGSSNETTAGKSSSIPLTNQQTFIAANPAVKRARAQSNLLDSEDELNFQNEDDDDQLNKSVDLFSDATEDLLPAPPKTKTSSSSGRQFSNNITFDFAAKAERESIPVQPSKKFIYDPTEKNVLVSEMRRSARLASPLPVSAPAATTSTVDLEEQDEEDVFVDVFEKSIMLDEEDEPKVEVAPPKPPTPSHVGKLYAPDETILTPMNATFVTDTIVPDKSKKFVTLNETVSLSSIGPEPSSGKFTNLNVTVTLPESGSRFGKFTALNETVSIPGGSTFGNHVPKFQEFNSSRHQASTLDILEEEDDTEFATPSAYPKSLLPESVAKIDKKKKETSTSSSSSSSSSSFKSAVSSFQQPKKVMPAIVTAKKLDIIKKREEDAQRNRAENLKKKQEFQKKKNEEWKQKTDKIKLEQEKLSAAAAVKKNIVPNPAFSAVGNVNSKPVIGMSKLPPKVPIQQHGPPPPTSSNYNFNFGNAPPGMNNRLLDNIGGFKASGPMKSYIKQKPGLQPSTSTGRSMPIMGHYPPPMSTFSNVRTPNKSDTTRGLPDDLFKTPGNMNASISFLDSTVDSGPGNSYDITMYEDLDEELKHRENKSVPAWANDKLEIPVLLFKQLDASKIKGVGFPFPNVKPGYRLFNVRR
ncbi:titin isoform X2 [Folsomia candida]|uniref:titin isoform X2 n=1 Tax=Folsomia candida TaxID=158441 RepID=UPI000B90028A|nr:titin isoform X2 [Folsomia candida]